MKPAITLATSAPMLAGCGNNHERRDGGPQSVHPGDLVRQQKAAAGTARALMPDFEILGPKG